MALSHAAPFSATASIPRLIDLAHESLTYHHNGGRCRLTDVLGPVATAILA